MEEQTKLEAFRQHWEQIRHSENMRLTFTSFYAAMVAAILGFVSQGEQTKHPTLFIVLAVISLLGLILSYRIWKAVEYHCDKAQLLASKLTRGQTELEKYVPYYGRHTSWYRFWNLRVFFPILYIAGLFFFLLLASGKIRVQ